jgi:hypothetical protein
MIHLPFTDSALSGGGPARLVARDSILSRLARQGAKKKSDDGEELPAPMDSREVHDSENAMINQITRINAIVVALLMTASAVNGIIFYAYL